MFLARLFRFTPCDIKKMQLPVNEVLEQLREALGHHANVVLVAPPGAGKTTGVPLVLMDEPWLAGQRILMLEPRRLAARASARRMAETLGEPVGRRVGYRTRMDTRVSAVTRIEVVTEGILTRMLLSDPELNGYGLVIFDEFHERSLHADCGLALAREVQQVLRPALKMLVMSATLDGAAVARLLDDAPVIRSQGRAYPVEIVHRPAGSRPWLDHAAAVILDLVGEQHGSMLVFLPGGREIRQVARTLADRLPDDVRLYRLYGGMDSREQDRVLAVPGAGERKLVLATAIAETSLTLPGVRVVIDCGYERRPHFDAGSGMNRLITRRVSAATADQRAGRAGRERPGLAVRLWPANEVLAPFSPPEVQQADLGALVLDLACWGCRDPSTLAWLDPPPPVAWQQAVALLERLDALGPHGLTDHGRAMQALPLHPRLAAMLLAARERGLGELAAKLALLLEESGPGSAEGVDLRKRLRQFEQPGPDGERLRSQLARLLPHERDQHKPVADPGDAAGALLAIAFPDRIAKRRAGGMARFLLANGRGAWLPDEDQLAAESWLVAPSVDGDRREARIFLAAPLSRATLEADFQHRINVCEEVEWDELSSSVRARRVRRLDALVLDADPVSSPAPALVEDALLDGLARRGAELLPWTPALRQWQARVTLMAALEPDDWPAVDDATLVDTREAWARPFLAAVVAARNWGGFPLGAALSAQLSAAQRQRLEMALPQRVAVPSGNEIAIDYLATSGPVLAVKLQEMFGLQQTPRLAGGRVVLQIHLLSPARRPVAITADLHSFWRQGYPQVRKDLRGRYPKHPWPEDPFTAVAQAGIRRHK